VAQTFAHHGIPQGAIGTDVATGQPTIMGPNGSVLLNTPEGQAILAAHQAGQQAIAAVQASSPTAGGGRAGGGGEAYGGPGDPGLAAAAGPSPLILGRFTRAQVGCAAAGVVGLAVLVLVLRR
jgi:hypothetical protein